MRLWMIADEAAVSVLARDGELTADARRATQEWLPAYRWMADQMVLRLGPPPRQGALPLWAWAQWLGPNRCRPDMRYGSHLPPGTACARLTLEIPARMVLLSDFDDWHVVLNNWYLALSQAEDDSFAEKIADAGLSSPGPYPEPFQSQVTKSWERIFDIDRTGWDPAWNGDLNQRSLQATLWRVGVGQVRKVEWFRAR